MVEIREVLIEEIPTLVELAQKTFIQSHGHSASEEDISAYVLNKMNIMEFEREFKDHNSFFYILEVEDQIIGYSKLAINTRYKNISEIDVCKLERIYLLKEFIGHKLGWKLLNFNIGLAKNHHQEGMWLYTWIENHIGIDFYTKAGFKIVGHEDFKISESHSNPNHIMYLKF